MESAEIRIVLLGNGGASSRIVYHALRSRVKVETVVVELAPPRIGMIRRRWVKLGPWTTIGQLLFMALNKSLAPLSRKKIAGLMAFYGLDAGPLPREVIRNVESVNGDEVIDLLQRLQPDAVVVNGTRILSKKLLASVPVPFINTHMGITPKYRGVHGGYWALAAQDPEHCGVTVHLVDPGIDTGGVLYQDVIQVNRGDHFNTYPVHQIAKAIPLLLAALQDARDGRLRVREGVPPSCLHYHPTLLEYVRHWVRDGVR